MKLVFGVLLLVCQLIGSTRPILAAESKASWQAEWDRTVRAAEQEGQVTVSIGGYGAIIDAGVFQKTYPKIKITHITGAGTDLTQRIIAERRAGKYLVDVYNGGGNSLFQVLYLGKMLDPIKPALILPEVTDATKWWEGKQKYADKEGQHIFVYEANVAAGAGAAYNTQLIDPNEYKTYWDLLNPKLKGKILSTDIRRVRGAGIPVAVSLLSPRSRTEISAPLVRRDGRHAGRRSASGRRLAGHGKIYRGHADSRGNDL